MAYSDGEKAEALIKLALNKYNYSKTSRELEIPRKTLRAWNRQVPKKGVFELLERAIWHLLANMPTEWKRPADWAVAIGILIDKYQLMQGEPTERKESLVRGIQDLTDDEREAAVSRAREILAGFSVGGDGTGVDATAAGPDNGTGPA